MSRNLKKFINPKFTRTVPIEPMKRLLGRHRDEMAEFDFSLVDGDEAALRAAILDFFAGPKGDGPGLVADLHRIAAVGTCLGLELLLEEARRNGVVLVLNPGRDPAREDPKHVALTAFLDHLDVFNAAAERLAYFSSAAVAEFVGRENGVKVELDEGRKAAFKKALADLFETNLHGSFCRVGWHTDDNETVVAITHGAPIVTTPTIEADKEHVLCYRPLETAFLAYAATDGRLKLRRVGQSRRAPMVEAFAKHVLQRSGLFAGAAARDLYTLRPVERAWPAWRPTHGFDPLIRRVRVTEVQLDRLAPALVEEMSGTYWSVTIRDRQDCALARLREMCPGLSFASGAWGLGLMTMRVDIEVGRRKPAPVLVTIRPRAEATFRRDRFEAQIMEMLRRNGFCCDKATAFTALAAE